MHFILTGDPNINAEACGPKHYGPSVTIDLGKPPAEKRQLIDGAYYEMIRIAKSGVEVVRAFENKVSTSQHYERLKAAGFTDQEISDWKP